MAFSNQALSLRKLALGCLIVLLTASCTSLNPEYVQGIIPQVAEPSILEPITVGNVFTVGEPIRIGVNAAGSRLTFELRDVHGVVVKKGSRNLARGVLELRLPRGEQGFYRLKVQAWRGNRLTEEAETTLAVLSPFDFANVLPDDSIFAAQTHFVQFLERPLYDPVTQRYVTPGVPRYSAAVAPLIAKAGARTVRDELPWSVVEPPEGGERGAYAFPETFDRYMRALEESGLRSLTILNYGNRLYDVDEEGIGAIPYTDEGRQGYADYGVALRDRYGTQIVEFEVWNEPNAGGAPWNRGPCNNVGPVLPNPVHIECYVELLKTTYETIKAEHPYVRITGPAGVTIPYSYLEALFRAGALDYLDAVTIHPYAAGAGAPEFAYGNPAAGFIGTTIADRVHQLRELIRRYNSGQDKPIYFTEIGWPSGNVPGAVSELSQAKYLVRMYAMAIASGVEKVFWYEFVNNGLERDRPGQNYGLVHIEGDPLGSFTPKPSFVAYAVAAQQLTGAHFVSETATPSGVWRYTFARDGATTDLIWLPADTNVNSARQVVTLHADGPLTVTDMVGKTRHYTPLDGKVYLTVSGDPIYVSGPLIDVTDGAALSLEPGPSSTPLVLTVDNRGGTKPLHAIFDLSGEGRAYPVLAQPGEVVRREVALSGEPGLRTVFADVTVRGQLVGTLSRSVYIVNPAELPFAENVLYGDTFPYPGTRGLSLRGMPPEIDNTSLGATYTGFAPAQFVVSSIDLANSVNDGRSGALRVAPPAGADVTLVLPVPARRFSAEVDLVPFTGSGDGSRNVGLFLTSAGEGNFFNSPVAFRAGIGLLNNHSLRVQKRGGNQHLTPVGELTDYAPDNWNRLRLDVDLDAGTITIFFNGVMEGSHRFLDLERVEFVGLEAAPGTGGGTAYLDNFSVSPLEGGQ